MRLRALLLTFLLLLPSGLWAAVASAQNCAAQKEIAAMECCCTHPAPSEDHKGAQLIRDCCCEAKAPLSPTDLPDAQRILDNHESFAAPMAPVENLLPPTASWIGLPSQLAPPGPPRAPPQPLFIQFQRFLI